MQPSAPRHDLPAWLQTARQEVGVKEFPGKASNPQVEKYHGATAAGRAPDDIAWCSSFVNWCLEKNNIQGTRSKRAASWRSWGVGCALQPGAIVFFGKKDPDAGGSGHVAFADHVDPNGIHIWVCGGNQRDAVSIAPRRIADIAAIRWPKTKAITQRPPAMPGSSTAKINI